MEKSSRNLAGFLLWVGGIGLAPALGDKLDFAAKLDGVCSGSGATQQGWMTVTLDTATSGITYHLSYDAGVGATFQHIHGPVPTGCGAGGTGAIIVDLGSTNPSSGSTTLAASNVDDLIGGRLYANVHNGPFPDGVITGDLYPVPKNRFISVAPSKLVGLPRGLSANFAIRVRLTSLHHPLPAPSGTPDFSAFEGEVRWAGPIQTVNEPPRATTHRMAKLQCDPLFLDLGAIPDLLHLFGAEVMPSSVYEVDAAHETCADLNDPDCYTPVLTVTTGRWGDILAPFSAVTGSQPNFGDIGGIVGHFTGSPTAPVMVRANLKENEPNLSVSFIDISRGVQAFQGAAYPFAGPTACP